MTLSTYTYKPLQSATHVRRLRRVDNGPNEGLHFQIAQFDQISSTSPPYYSLSYTWGNPLDCDADAETEAEWRNQHEIFLCEEDGEWSTLSVTTNLYDFLREFSTADLNVEILWIWIDAICINQGDIAERGVQVGLMRDIYLLCAEVIIWLGREGEETAFMSVCVIVLDGWTIAYVTVHDHNCFGNPSRSLRRVLRINEARQLVAKLTGYFQRPCQRRLSRSN